MILSKETYEKIDKELTKFPPERKRSAAIAAMTLAQDEMGWLSPEVTQEIADYLGVPPIALQEIASFYSMFNVNPVGKYKITVCTNLPCELSGGMHAAQYLQKKLGIGFGETTPDGLFTLIEGECMGACGDGPVLLINNKKMHMRMSNSKIDKLLEDLPK